MWVQNFVQRYKKKRKFPNIFAKKYTSSPKFDNYINNFLLMQPFKTSLQAFFQISRATTEWQSELIST